MKNNFTVYAAGPMEGLSIDEMTGWRKEFRLLMADIVVDVLDPTRRAPFHTDDSDAMAKLVFKLDLMDIDNSDLAFFDMRRGKGKAWGTCMEMMYAWTKQIPIVVWVNPEDFRHPFIESMHTVKVTTLQDGQTAIQNFLG